MKQKQWWDPEPLMLPRWTLYIVYGLYVLFGLGLAYGGSSELSPDYHSLVGALGPYGTSIAIIATLCVVAALSPKHPLIESVFSGFLCAVLSSYFVLTLDPLFTGDLDVATRVALLLIAGVIPAVRCISLGNIAIRKWARRD